MTKITGSGSGFGSTLKCHGSGTLLLGMVPTSQSKTILPIFQASEESSSGHSTPREKDEPVVRTASMLDEALRAKDESGRKTTKRKDDAFKDEEEEEEGVEIRQDEYTSLLPRGIIVARFCFRHLYVHSGRFR